MDLGAYIQISKLEEIAKKNGIDIPRLRGYRLMSEEKPVSEEIIKRMIKERCIYEVEQLCEAEPFWDPNPLWYTYNDYVDYLKRRYLTYRKDENGHIEYTGIRWNRIHGWKRKVLKFEIKKAKRRIRQQYDLWNKYAGQENVLYIHSRIGGNNWSYFKGDEKVASQPWFLNRVDDSFDNTYCDIYARIGDRLIDYLKAEYLKSEVVMTEFLRNYPNLGDEIESELLKWAGEEEYSEAELYE